MKTKILIFIIATLLYGCGVYTNVYSDYDRNADFTQYKTYAWLNTHKSHASTQYDNDIIENNTKDYIDHEFINRGYSVNVDTPDILLELVLLSEKKKEKITTSNPYNYNNNTYNNSSYNSNYNNNLYNNNQNYNRYNNRYNNRNYNSYNNYNSSRYNYTTATIEYTKSTITINVIDTKQNKLIWSGTAEGDIYDPEYFQYEIHPAIDKIMKQYPN